MGALNGEGIFEYDGTETGAPGASFMNLLADSITDVATDIRADITALDLLADSGWTTISTFGTGWSATAGHTPRVRKIGNLVKMVGAVTRSGTSGAASDILTIPTGFRLAGAYTLQFIGCVVTSGGTVHELFINTTAHKLQVPSGYSDASLGSGIVLPLDGEWFTD